MINKKEKTMKHDEKYRENTEPIKHDAQERNKQE